MSAATAPAASPYEAAGGAERLRALARRFVAEVQALPAQQPLRRLFAAEMSGYEQRLFEFLCGWLGGPPLYTQRHGLPNLRERHRHLPIGQAERDQWLQCMRRALAAEIAPAARARLDAAFWTMADSLRNREEAAEAAAASALSPAPRPAGPERQRERPR